jgi:hypothetical protein
LWADALCINQSDLEERASQVQLMAQIYTGASKVLIWLGMGDSFKIQVALSYVCRIMNKYYAHRLPGGRRAVYRWNEREMDFSDDKTLPPNPGIGEFTLLALRCLFACPYFRRGWVVQEAVLHSTNEVFWGKARLDFEWLGYTAHHLENSWSLLSGASYEGLEAVSSMRILRIGIHEISSTYRFSSLLIYTRCQSFSDPRDHVYGLLGLKTACCELTLNASLFQPDYNAGVADCYRTATEALLECGDIGILALVEHFRTIADNWPSWVPRLNRLALGIPNYRSWSSSGDLLAESSRQVHDGNACMRMRGFCVDKVVGIHKTNGNKSLHTLLGQLAKSHGTERVAWNVTLGFSPSGTPLYQSWKLEDEHLKNFDAYLDVDSIQPNVLFPQRLQ